MILLNNKTKSQIVNKSKGLKLKKDEETFMRCFGLKTNIPKVLDKNGIWRTKVLKRGGFCCAVCGFKDKSGIGLQAHHIKPVRDCDKKEKYDINNGICLCVECHKKAYMKEYDFFETFIGILEA
jgi:5-methylcytosine-specific restriction endonuclease McrA